MGINIQVKKGGKQKNEIFLDGKLNKDLRDCMHCQFFYGNNHQCIQSNCVKEKERKQTEPVQNNKCTGCPYKQSDRYCFPCMKELLGMQEGRDTHEKIILEQEKFKNG